MMKKLLRIALVTVVAAAACFILQGCADDKGVIYEFGATDFVKPVNMKMAVKVELALKEAFIEELGVEPYSRAFFNYDGGDFKVRSVCKKVEKEMKEEVEASKGKLRFAVINLNNHQKIVWEWKINFEEEE